MRWTANTQNTVETSKAKKFNNRKAELLKGRFPQSTLYRVLPLIEVH